MPNMPKLEDLISQLTVDEKVGMVAGVAPFATGGVTAVAAPATATPARNLRRFTSGRGSFRAMELSLDGHAPPPAAGDAG